MSCAVISVLPHSPGSSGGWVPVSPSRLAILVTMAGPPLALHRLLAMSSSLSASIWCSRRCVALSGVAQSSLASTSSAISSLTTDMAANGWSAPWLVSTTLCCRSTTSKPTWASGRTASIACSTAAATAWSSVGTGVLAATGGLAGVTLIRPGAAIEINPAPATQSSAFVAKVSSRFTAR